MTNINKHSSLYSVLELLFKCCFIQVRVQLLFLTLLAVSFWKDMKFSIDIKSPTNSITSVFKWTFNQGILKEEVSLYCWPPVWLVWITLFCKYKQKLSVVIQLILNQSNRRSMVQWQSPCFNGLRRKKILAVFSFSKLENPFSQPGWPDGTFFADWTIF